MSLLTQLLYPGQDVFRIPDTVVVQPWEEFVFDAVHAGSPFIRHDPLHGGISIGPTDQNIRGTLGCIVNHNSTGAPFLLSNRHVFFPEGKEPAGQNLRSPFPPAKGQSTRNVGTTSAWKSPPAPIITVKSGNYTPPSNASSLQAYYDAAIARPTVNFTYEIPGIGVPTGHIEPKAGMNVKLLGSTSGLQPGKIVQADYTTCNSSISVAPKGKCMFQKAAFLHSCNSGPGDSGSPIVDTATRRVVGLHFAGNENANRNVGCRAGAIASAFNVNFVGKVGTFNSKGVKIGGGSGPSPTPGPTPGPTPTPTPLPNPPIVDFIAKHPEYVAGGIAVLALLMIIGN